MPSGGKRIGAGRKHGSKNIRTAIIAQKALAAGLTPVEYLLSVMRDESQPQDIRIQCAIAAAPYTTPRLAHIHQTRSNPGALEKLYAKMQEEKHLIERTSMQVLDQPVPMITDAVFSQDNA